MKSIWWIGLFMLALPTASSEAAPSGKPAVALPELTVSAPSRFCDAPFVVKLEPPSDGAIIRFTTNCAERTLQNGSAYNGPLNIANTTILRAAAFKEGRRVSAIGTRSYIFWEQVTRQPKEPPGLPVGPRAWNGTPSAYQMDPRVVHDPLYRDQMKQALQALPVVSVVCKSDDMFGPRTGLYLNSEQRGEAWEKPCSVELILPGGGKGFQVDCGIRIQGNSNRMPWKSPKRAFRLMFKEKYGPSKLHYQMFPDSSVTKFDTLVLRADFNNSWIHWDASARPRGQRVRDAWMKDSHRAMGWVAGHNRFVHLYLNGFYWGVYDMAERLDASFAASYFGGSKNDYDVINEFQVKNGTLDAFRNLYSIRGLSNNAQYKKLQQQLNVTAFIDFLLLNYYAGNQDVGEDKNWYAIRRKAPPGPFQYFVWDPEQSLIGAHDDTVNQSYVRPFHFAHELAQNAEYKLAFADRVQKHFFNDGALTPAAAAERWMKRAKEVDLAMIAESARWGYYRRNPPFTRNRDFLAEQQRLLQSYFPTRTRTVLEQLREAGLYPRIAAPSFSQHGGAVPEGFKLSITSPSVGAIYYTTDGFDPRVPGTDAVSPHARAYASPVPVPASVQVKARVLKENIWSALTDATFTNAAAAAAK